MKVIAINGSPRKNGNTATALKAMTDELEKQGIETELIQVGSQDIHGCTFCGHCFTSEGNRCVFKDDCVNEVARKMREADGFILGAPTYYGGMPGPLKSFLDRVLLTSSGYFHGKVATSVVAVRRAAGVDVVHQLDNYLHLAHTVMPPSQYWPVVFGMNEGEIAGDGEGMQTILNTARAMAWLLKIIDASKKTYPYPDEEPRILTNFIR